MRRSSFESNGGRIGLAIGALIGGTAMYATIGLLNAGDKFGDAILECDSRRDSEVVFADETVDNNDIGLFMSDLRSSVDSARQDPYTPTLVLRGFRDEGFNPNPIDVLADTADDNIELEDIQAGEIVCRTEDGGLNYTKSGNALISSLGVYEPERP